MFKTLGHIYYELGDSIVQDAYPGCPATIVEVLEESQRQTLYRVDIDTSNEPEATDENGDHESLKHTLVRQDTMERLNP